LIGKTGTMDVDVAVIGRGMIGGAAGRHLAEQGRSVALIGPGDQYSSHGDAARITRIVGRTGIWTELAAQAIGRYGDIAERSGIDFHVPCGFLAAHLDAADWAERAAVYGSDARLVDRAWVRETTGINISNDLDLVFEGAPGGYIRPRRLVAAQSRLAEAAGATVINAEVDSLRGAAGGFEVSGSFGTISARQVLLATGAFAGDLAAVQLAVERRPRTVVMVEWEGFDDGREIPSLICDQPVDERVEGIYWNPPAEYPDGVRRIKIGGNLAAFVPLEQDQLVDWFHSDGNPDEVDSLSVNLRALLPDADFGPLTSKPCVITGTVTGYPYIGWIDEGIAVARGGNGSSAKSSDEVGRIAAGLFSEAGWDSSIDQSIFTPVHV
jgi:sarcosine oxidase